MSNAYINQIFSEQPLAVWALDDDISYLSLFLDSQRKIRTAWSLTNSATSTELDETLDPYYALDKTVNRIVKTSVSSSGNFIATSDETFTAENDYFNIGFYYLKDSPYVSSIEIGYKIGATTTYATSIPTSVFYEWTFISATFPSFVGSANIVIKFNYAAPAVTDSVSILMNGLTVGEKSEVSNQTSLGATEVSLPSALDSATGLSCKGVAVSKHASNEEHGYYIIDEKNNLCARSSASTMVYGGTTSVTLTPAYGEGKPSMVLNSYGFLSKTERYRSRTLEMWLRIKTKATTLTRIIGPIASDDGLYVEGPYLVLKAGKYSGSYYVGEWQRPMLVQISVSPNNINLFINGGKAISINVDEIPEFVSQYDVYDSDEPEWLGFYTTLDVPQIDIDAVAIYPYETDEEKSLRRFGYAQAVKFPQDLVAAHDGETLYTDYSLANYGKSKSYGNNLKDVWDNGYLDNFVSESNVLKTISFGLPEIEIEPGAVSTLTQDKFFVDLSTAIGSSSPFIDMQPTSDWSGVDSHIFFSTLSYGSITSGTPKSIYVMATRSEANTSRQTLFRLSSNNGHIEAYTITQTSPTTANKVIYEFVYKGSTQQLGSVSGNVIGTKFIAGIDIQDLKDNGPDGMSEFLSESLRLYIGGSGNFSSTFTGKIYKVSISNDRNRLGIKDFFTDGVFSGVLADLETHYASYSLNAKKVFGLASLDVSANSYWRDSLPISSLRKRVEVSSGVFETKVDMLQINMDAPEPITFSGGNYNTSDSSVKAYITFKVGDISDFTIQPLDQGKLNVPDTDWETVAYEVVDGAIVKMPDVLNSAQTSITFHILANTENTNFYRTTIRSFQIAAITNETYDTAKATVGTRYGVDLQSFQASADTQNLFVMPRYTDEYYYLSNNSGIKLVGDIDATYGYRMSLNKSLASPFNIGAFQISMKLALQEFSTSPVLLFYVSIGNNRYRFYIDSYNSSNSRAKIYARYYNGTSESDYNSLEYFVNNVGMTFPVVNADEWFTLNINFKENISLNSTEGFVSFCGPMIVNNFSYVQLSDEQKSQSLLVQNKWIDAKYSATSSLTWNYWATGARTWNTVGGSRAAASGVTGFDSQELYRSITKTGVISAGYEPNQKLLAQSFKYYVYSGVVIDKKTTPVT
jgi:hypothetical protein